MTQLNVSSLKYEVGTMNRTMPKDRRIAHIDMDAFFASCELSRYPELKGLPMVVAGGRAHAPKLNSDGTWKFARLRDYVGRGVLTTATYEARALGVHSAMPTMKAAILAPNAIILPVDFELYREYSRKFKNAVRSVSEIVEDIGIDEVYADISHLSEALDEIAKNIRNAVSKNTGLTCSVGIAPNKLLAKLASEMNKPDGYTIISEGEIKLRIWPLRVGKVNGIGPKAEKKLASFNVHTVGDLAAKDPLWLMEYFGRKYGQWLANVALGKDNRIIVTQNEPVSMSRETTFERNLHAVRDKEELGIAFTKLCRGLAEELRRKGYVCRRVGIKVRFDDFSTVTRDVSFAEAIGDAKAIRRIAGKCIKRIDLTRQMRLLGVKVGNLEKFDLHATNVKKSQLELLFEESHDQKDDGL